MVRAIVTLEEGKVVAPLVIDNQAILDVAPTGPLVIKDVEGALVRPGSQPRRVLPWEGAALIEDFDRGELQPSSSARAPESVTEDVSRGVPAN